MASKIVVKIDSALKRTKPLSIALCNEVIRELNFREQCIFARSVGYDGLEIAPFTLSDNPEKFTGSDVADYRRIAESEGVAITGLHWLMATPQGLSITSRDDEVYSRSVAFGQSLIGLCRDLGGQYLVHGSPAQRNLQIEFEEEERKRGTAYFAQMADAAFQAGVDYVIEPLSHNITNYINTVEEAADIINEVGSGSLRTMIDCYASASDNIDICELIERWVPAGLVCHIHFNDDNECGPGEGSIDFGPILSSLAKVGYTGSHAVEPFKYEPNGTACAARAIGYLQGLNGAINMRELSEETTNDNSRSTIESKTVHNASPRREKGRRNPKATRASILAAARTEFAEKGLNGGRVAQIANNAGVNKQLVYYYFGSKDELYKSALEAIYEDIRSREHELDLSLLSPRKAIIRLVDFSLNYLNEHRDFIRILADENTHGARHLHSSEIALKTNSPLLDMIGEALKRGAKAGVFRPDIDPLELYVSIAGMTFFYFSNGLTLSAIFGRDLSTPEAFSSYRDHIVTLTLEGLRP